MQLPLKKFDITDIRHDKVIVLIGKRETGKSFLVRDILFHNRAIPIGTVISPTEESNKFYSNMIPHMFIHDEFSPDIIDNVIKRQKLLARKVDKQIQVYGSSNIDTRAFLILDDCLFDKTWASDTGIRYLFMNGRHLPIMFMITMQHPMGIPHNLRTNIDYVFILRENVVSNRKRIYDNYAGMFPSFDMFCQVMDQCTENYECLVINNNVQSNKLEDQVFWYKAEPHDHFKLGSKEVWELARRTKQKWDDGEDSDEEGGDSKKPYDKRTYLQGKGGKRQTQISVKKTMS
eukprot:gene9413-biopygen9358